MSSKVKRVHDVDEIPTGELIWATAKGFPKWPAVTCPRVNRQTCVKVDNQGRKLVFVVFIEKTPTSGYVDEKDVHRFDPSLRSVYLNQNGNYFSTYPGWYWGVVSAMDTFSPMKPTERLDLLNGMVNAAKIKEEPSGKQSASDDEPKKKKHKGVEMKEFCICKIRLPANGKFASKEVMIPCCVCQDYFHLSCAGLKQMPTDCAAWVCDSCAEDPSQVHLDPPEIASDSDEPAEKVMKEMTEVEESEPPGDVVDVEKIEAVKADDGVLRYNPLGHCQCEVCGPKLKESRSAPPRVAPPMSIATDVCDHDYEGNYAE